MSKAIEIIRKTRINLLDAIKDLNIDQLNTIPQGFNNNIIWNLAHMVAAQQGVCYKRAGLEVVTGENFWKTYTSGTKPEKLLNEEEVETIKELLLSTLDQLETDLKTGMFANYAPWTTRYGVALTNIDEAIGFLIFHEGLHSGYIWAMKRVTH